MCLQLCVCVCISVHFCATQIFQPISYLTHSERNGTLPGLTKARTLPFNMALPTVIFTSQCMHHTCPCNLLGIACIVSVVCACFVPMQRQLLLFSSNSYPSRLIWYVTVHSTLGRHSCLNFFFLLWFSCVFLILKD